MDVARSQLQATLVAALAGGAPERVHAVRPGGRPPRGAQSFPLPRLMLTLAGRHLLDASAPSGPRAVECRGGDALFTCPQAWTRPAWRARHRFFAIVCHHGFTRYLQFATDARGAVDQGSRRWFHTAADTRPALAETLRALTVASAREVGPDDDALRGLARGAFHLAVEELAAAADLPADPGEALLRRLRAWLDERVGEDCGRDRAARELGVHPNHLSRLVRRHADCRYVDLVAETRLHRAAGLLAHSDMGVAEIAGSLGFGTSTWLIRRFKAHFGVTPGRYRSDVAS